LGKALLAHQSKEEMNRIIQGIRLKPYTKNTIISKKGLKEELQEIREKGYSLDRREIEEEVECIGAPIRDHRGDVIAAISISGPQRKIGTPHEAQFVSQVVEAAALISSRMGYRGESKEVGRRGKDGS
jgi:DNA-binding IclR family transcriptional regulator